MLSDKDEALQDIFLALGAETGERGDSAIFRCLANLIEGCHLERLVHLANALATRPRDAEHLPQTRWDAYISFIVNAHMTIRNQFCDPRDQRLAQAWDADKPAARDDVAECRLQPRDRTRAILVCTHLEGIRAIQLQQLRNFIEHCGDLLLLHGISRVLRHASAFRYRRGIVWRGQMLERDWWTARRAAIP